MCFKVNSLGLENLEGRLSLSVATTLLTSSLLSSGLAVAELSTAPEYANVQSLNFTTPASTLMDSNINSTKVPEDLPRPASNPAFPAGFDLFSPPVELLQRSELAPVLTTWTQTGTRNETLAITGERLSASTSFLAWGQTNGSNGTLAEMRVQHSNSQTAAATLSDRLPGSSVYLVWAKNESGYSAPVAINKAEGWWAGPDKAVAGEAISIYGRNLASAIPGHTSWVYLTQKDSSQGVWVKALAANPYRIDIQVPSTLPAGEYQAWVHNGHGGEFGWSTPVTLTVQAPQTWSDTVFNVKTFGAKGNGIADDEAAIQAAILAARESKYTSSDATIYFPAGTYVVSKGFHLPSNVRLMGAGKGETIIKVSANSAQLPQSDIRGVALFVINKESRVEIANMTLDANKSLKSTTGTVVYARETKDFRLSGVRVLAQNFQTLDTNNSRYVFVSGCDFVGKGVFLGTASQTFLDRNNFYGTNDVTAILQSWAGKEVSITNCIAQDLDNSNPDSGSGWSSGRFFAGLGTWGSEKNYYFGGNSTINLGVRSGASDPNSGEQILWEHYTTRSEAQPIAATSTTVQFPELIKRVGATPLTTGYLTITQGTGLGQYREIKSYDEATRTFTLYEPWIVAPDSSSTVAVGNVVSNVAVFGNSFSGRPEQATGTSITASSGVQVFGSGSNFVVDNNSFLHIRNPISFWSNYNTPDKSVVTYTLGAPTYSNMFVNNRMTAGTTGVLLSSYSRQGILGTVIRSNVFSGFVGTDHLLRSANTDGLSLTVIEHNVSTGSRAGITLQSLYSGSSTAMVVLENRFDLGKVAIKGSVGVNLSDKFDTKLGGNQYVNYEKAYVGNVTAACPEFEFPGIQATIDQGSTGKLVIGLLNPGTNPMAYSLSDDATWIRPFSKDGVLASEQKGAIGLFVDASQLKPGNYETVVRVSANGETRDMKVRLVVSKPAVPTLSETLVRPSQASRVSLLPSTSWIDESLSLQLPRARATEETPPEGVPPVTVVRPTSKAFLPSSASGVAKSFAAITNGTGIDWSSLSTGIRDTLLSRDLLSYGVDPRDTFNAWKSALGEKLVGLGHVDLVRLFLSRTKLS